ncbi:capsular polysaccharide transport system permease protein [Sphingobium jiangsuense]|uniref:Capsular polysaccharide transport system permease protein n=1 Tax=Sphingobium jiangsuense TaxID=870476 RepID=A0A7W6BFX8_9SPHN|nr:hypothetical protein [Sphingobium jiangsuense]MBB3926255.1 capsular polysaccharide transport system permease protein [Sphingobium jiangsuense]
MQNLFAKIRNANKIFLATVIAPTAIAILYFGFIASDIYISEAAFVVRRPDKPSGSPFGSLLKTAGFSNGSDEMYAAQSYVRSRDALRQLNRNEEFRKAYTHNLISPVDRFNPTGFFASFEDLYQFYLKKIAINYDPTSSISTLTVRAYTKEDAHRLNEQLLQLTEATVNRLNQRARNDLIRVAEAELAEAKQKAQTAAQALARYRNRSGIIDPERQALIQMQMISKLQDQLITTNTQLSQLRNFTPSNPQIPVLETTVQSLQREIERRTKEIAGSKESLSDVAVEYQRLSLESQFADKQMAAMFASLADARSEARKQQAYIERIAQPSLPDTAVEPKRIRGILTTFVLGLIAFGILSMLLAGVREHRD